MVDTSFRASDRWAIQPYYRYDKRVIVEGPDEVRLEVDTDDVDKEIVMARVRQMVDVLNAFDG